MDVKGATMTNLEVILEVAKNQEGYVANYQVDVTRQMFSHLESQGTLERIQRGIYRVSFFPLSEDEQFIVAYLWSRERGVISHESALASFGLSDVLPNSVHLTYPDGEALPQNTPGFVTLHRGEVPDADRQWYGNVPVTTVSRTLIDLAAGGFDADLWEQALDQALESGLLKSGFERTVLRELMTRRGAR